MLFAVLFFGIKRITDNQQKALIVAIATIVLLNLYEILLKMYHEDLL
jgi:hypothetical protein